MDKQAGELNNSRVGVNPVVIAPRSARLARAISDLTVPPLAIMPTSFMLGAYDLAMHDLSWANLGFAWLACVLLSVVWPVLFVVNLKSHNRINDLHIPIRQQRTGPYLVMALSYFLSFLLVYVLIGGGLLAATQLCYTLDLLVVLLINLAWKISAHMVGVTAPLTALSWVFGIPSVAPLYLCAILVAWARLRLRAHTPAQVIGGTIFGVVFTSLQLLYIFRPLGWA